MIFADLWFLAFFLGTLGTVWFVPENFRRHGLLAACLVFHAHYAGPAGMGPIVVLAALTFFALNAKDRLNRLIVITLSVGALVYYKYSGFLNTTFGTSIPVTAAPLAISFFVFEFVHLLSDRNRKKLKGPVKPLDFSLFTIFFPSLASGPIKRYQQFIPELARLGRPAWPLIAESLVRILFGYYKKFCIADALSYELPEAQNIWKWHSSVAILALLQGIRIFMDFSGYSDIALGFAGLLNIRLPENFSFPYLATNIQEFWRRWHISLSSWIRDYVYIILGGNRVSNLRRLVNLMAAMVLCGFWHGAATHFALWGLIHGAALLAQQLWLRQKRVRLPAAVAWGLTFAFVQLTWLLFFYDVPSIQYIFKEYPFL